MNMFGGWWLVVGGGGVGDVCSSGGRTRGHTLIFDKLMVRLLRTADCAVSRVWDPCYCALMQREYCEHREQRARQEDRNEIQSATRGTRAATITERVLPGRGDSALGRGVVNVFVNLLQAGLDT